MLLWIIYLNKLLFLLLLKILPSPWRIWISAFVSSEIPRAEPLPVAIALTIEIAPWTVAFVEIEVI
jgi:hypothetical protein